MTLATWTTPFFIMEEDWRLTRHDGFSRAELLEQQRERGEKIVSLSPDCPLPGAATDQSSGEALYHRAAVKDDWWHITREMHPAPLPGKAKGEGKKDAKTRQVQAWPLRTTKPSAEEFENTSSFLKQLVRLVTAVPPKPQGRSCVDVLEWHRHQDEKPFATARLHLAGAQLSRRAAPEG